MSNRTKLRAAIATVFAVIAIGVIATAGATSKTSKRAGNQLAGTWTVTVNRPNLPDVSSLQAYTAQGSMVESGNDSAWRSPQYASWKRIRGRKYAATGLFFRFNPQTGTFLGRMKINRTIVLAPDGQSFTFSGSSTVLAADGSVVVTVPASGSGQRLQVEEQP